MHNFRAKILVSKLLEFWVTTCPNTDTLTLPNNTPPPHTPNDIIDMTENENDPYITNGLDVINTISLPGIVTVPLPCSHQYHYCH
jgi:hypothetical protein